MFLLRTRPRLVAMSAAVSLVGGSAAWATAGASPDPCAHQRRACVLATAATLLRAETHHLAVAKVPLDPEVAVYDLGQQPEHKPGGAVVERKALAASKVDRVTDPEWTVDGNVAFVAYQAHPTSGPTDFVAMRVTLRDGLIWEVMRDVQHGKPSAG